MGFESSTNRYVYTRVVIYRDADNNIFSINNLKHYQNE